MNCFELVRSVLDNAFENIEGTEEERFRKIKRKIGELSSGYLDIDNSPDFDYSDPITQFAYIYAYTTAHASYVCQLLDRGDWQDAIPKAGKVRLVCLGGGPGSDFLGALKFYSRSSYSGISIIANSFDRDRDWSFCWDSVLEQAEECSEHDGKCRILRTNFHGLDVCESKSIRLFRPFLDADLFCMTYFISEVFKYKDLAEPFFANLFSNIKKGALVTFIDNNSDKYYNWFDSLTSDNNFDILSSGAEQWTPTYDEEKKVLEKYTTRLGGRSPKLRANLAYRLLQKI